MAKRKNKKPKKKPVWPWLTDLKVLAGLVLMTLAIYLPTIGHQYTLDDAIVITENAYTQQGLSGIDEIFSYDTFRGFFKTEGKDNLVSGGRYRPLSLGVFAMEYQLFGLNPMWSHLLHMLWYLLLAVSVFRVCKFIALQTSFAVDATSFAGIAALLFAVHAVHTEVVANVKSRDEIMALLGGLWSLYFAMRYLSSRSWVHLFYSGVCMLLGLLAKENAITFVAVIPMVAFILLERSWRWSVKSVMGALVACLIYLLIRVSVLGFGIGGDPPLELMNNPFLVLVGNQYVPMAWVEKLPYVLHGLLKYLQLALLPYPLSHDYYPQAFGALTWASITPWLSLLLLVVLAAIAIHYRKKRRLVTFAILYFGATIFLTSNILFPIGTYFSERFVFFASLAPCLLVAAGIVSWSRRQGSGWPLWVLCGLVIGMASISATRATVWKDNFTLFTTDVRITSGSAKVQNAAGGEMLARAQSLTDATERKDLIDTAIGHLQAAIEIHPLYKNAYLLLGNAHFYLGAYVDAIPYYDRALALDPSYADAKNNRGITYRDHGRYLGEKQGNIDAAIEALLKAVAVLPGDYETNRLLGVAYGNKGQAEESLRYFTAAQSLLPDDAWANYNLGRAYLMIGDQVRGSQYLEKAKSIDPSVLSN